MIGCLRTCVRKQPNIALDFEKTQIKANCLVACLRTCVSKQPIIALYFEFENELKFYNLDARHQDYNSFAQLN